MLHKYFPYEYLDSPFSIDYQKLYDKGFRGIIFDIDNTLVPHGAGSTSEVDSLFEKIHAIGFKTLLLSNNSEERILSFIKNIDTLYIAEAGKPDVKNYFHALDMLGLKKENAVYVGDQITIDIAGANKAGIPNILVKFVGWKDAKKIGARRRLENLILKIYSKSKYRHRLGKISTDENDENTVRKRILFCEMNPFFYWISCRKETLRRHIKNIFSSEKFANEFSSEKFPNLVSSWQNALIKTGRGIDPVLQENKADNIKLACSKMNGLVIHPGESFSFWKFVGKPSRKSGFKEGRVIEHKKLIAGFGGGLCNLGNTIHLLVLKSPLTVTELHHHSDALAPDHGKRIPYSAGTSVSYNNVDFRFKNETDQNVQILLWCENGNLYGELRSEKEFPWTYKITEEDHHFHKEGGKYYRVSKIYKEIYDRADGHLIKKELNWDNHSEVMFDYDLIPQDQIR